MTRGRMTLGTTPFEIDTITLHLGLHDAGEYTRGREVQLSLRLSCRAGDLDGERVAPSLYIEGVAGRHLQRQGPDAVAFDASPSWNGGDLPLAAVYVHEHRSLPESTVVLRQEGATTQIAIDGPGLTVRGEAVAVLDRGLLARALAEGTEARADEARGERIAAAVDTIVARLLDRGLVQLVRDDDVVRERLRACTSAELFADPASGPSWDARTWSAALSKVYGVDDVFGEDPEFDALARDVLGAAGWSVPEDD